MWVAFVFVCGISTDFNDDDNDDQIKYHIIWFGAICIYPVHNDSA